MLRVQALVLARVLARLLALLLALLPAVVAAANLLPNSSFEAGIDAKLAIGRWYVAGLPALSLDATAPRHGRYSLRLPFSRIAYTPRPVDGIEIRSVAPVRLQAGVTYTLTASLRSDVRVTGSLSLLTSPASGHADAAAVAQKEVWIERDWRRSALTYRPAVDQDIYWNVAVRSEKPGSLWLDALQLEAGRFTAYAPARAVEAAIAARAEGAIFTTGEAAVLTVKAFNNGGEPVRQDYQIAVLDLDEKVVSRQSVTLELPAEDGVVREVRIPGLTNGAYKALLSPLPGEVTESEAHFSVLPPRRAVNAGESAFGVYATMSPEPLRILQRAGFQWLGLLTTNGRMTYWGGVEPEPGKFVWRDEELQLAQSLGFNLMFNLEPCAGAPQWAKALPRETRIELWTRYVRAMAGHYGASVRYWTIQDEVQETSSPEDWRFKGCWGDVAGYVDWHRAGAAALRAVDPGLRIILNAESSWAGPILAALPPDMVDVLADNSWNAAPDRLGKLVVLARQRRIPEVWAPGVGIGAPSWYPDNRKTRQQDPDLWSTRNRELAAAVVRSLAQGVRRLFHYTASYVGNTEPGSLFEADSSLRPTATQFASLIWLIDGSTSARPVATGLRETTRTVYRIDRADGLSVFPVFGTAAPAQALVLSGLEAGDVTAYDHFANRLPARVSAAGTFELSFGRDPVFLQVPRAAAERVERAFARADWRLDGLPNGASVEQAGNYAIVRGLRDNLYRPEPNVSLWYRVARRGWTEILRYRISQPAPTYRVTRAGFEIDWAFDRSRDAFILEPGGWPAELLTGARLLASRPGAAGLEWQASRIGAGETVVTERVGAGPAGVADPYTVLLQAPERAFEVRLRTELASDPALLGEQAITFGGWSLQAQSGTDYFLHQYYREGPAGPVRIRVRLDVRESQATAGGS